MRLRLKKKNSRERVSERRFRFPRRDSTHIERWVDSHCHPKALLYSHWHISILMPVGICMTAAERKRCTGLCRRKDNEGESEGGENRRETLMWLREKGKREERSTNSSRGFYMMITFTSLQSLCVSPCLRSSTLRPEGLFSHVCAPWFTFVVRKWNIMMNHTTFVAQNVFSDII